MRVVTSTWTSEESHGIVRKSLYIFSFFPLIYPSIDSKNSMHSDSLCCALRLLRFTNFLVYLNH